MMLDEAEARKWLDWLRGEELVSRRRYELYRDDSFMDRATALNEGCVAVEAIIYGVKREE